MPVATTCVLYDRTTVKLVDSRQSTSGGPMTAATGPPGAEANIGSTRLDHWNWNGMEDWVDDIWFLCWSACSRIDDFLDYVLRLLFLGLFLELSHSQNGKSRNDCCFLSSHICCGLPNQEVIVPI